MKASEFAQKFDDGEDVTDYLDLAKGRRCNLERTQVRMNFPAWMVRSIDKEAQRLGVSRQDIIKLWLADRLRQDHAYE